MSNDSKSIAVIGAGLMGHGIALEFALAGHDVRLHSRTKASLSRGILYLQESLKRLIKLGIVDQHQAAGIPEGITTTTSLSHAVERVEFVIESVYENLPLKIKLFQELDSLCPENTILVSNTSGFMPSALATKTRNGHRVVVGHYINPPFLIPLVEIIPGPETKIKNVESLVNLLKKLGKKPVVLNREVPGFVTSRLQTALLREALWLVENGVASPKAVDDVIKTSLGRRWAVAGVFEVLELAGWDLLKEITDELMPHLASSHSSKTLASMVNEGKLGAKSNQGFYEWTPSSVEAFKTKIAQSLVKMEQWSD